MPGNRRRYTRRDIKLLRRNPVQQLEEIKKYYLIKPSICAKMIPTNQLDSHINYVVLYIIISEANKMISVDYASKLLDIIEGYCFAFDEGLINSLQCWKKINVEIMQKKLRDSKWNYLGVFEDDLNK